MTVAAACREAQCDCDTATATAWWGFLSVEADATGDRDLRRLAEAAARHIDTITASSEASTTRMTVTSATAVEQSSPA